MNIRKEKWGRRRGLCVLLLHPVSLDSATEVTACGHPVLGALDDAVFAVKSREPDFHRRPTGGGTVTTPTTTEV